MTQDAQLTVVARGTRESAAMVADVKRAALLTARINRLTLNDAAEVRSLLGELIGKSVDESVVLSPPFFTTGGRKLSFGRNVFINQNCTFYDLGGITIADDVLIGPNVSLITSGHPVEPSRRRDGVVAKPIVVAANVWIAAGAIVIGGITIGEGSVVAAGAVVTRDVPPRTLVGGNPARTIRTL